MGMNCSKETSLFLSKHQLISSMELSNFGMVVSYLSDKASRHWYREPEEESATAYEFPVLDGSLDSKNQKSQEALTKDGLRLEQEQNRGWAL